MGDAVIHAGADLEADVDRTCDVCVVGSGAGGAVLAAGLSERGLSVVLLEEGGHHTSAEFRKADEAFSLPMLYQDRGTRATDDLAITLLQGRSVGGGTTVNWTTCFRTPDRILAHWRERHGTTWTSEELRPHFEAVEARLGIERWEAMPPNANNATLARAAEALGWVSERTRRNVRGCANSGYCGFGCPFDAKQAMGITYVADAVRAGAEVYADTRADRLVVERGRVVRVEASVLERERTRPTGRKVVVRPRVIAVCGGAINSPALLLRSGLDREPVGRRTMLHPVVGLVGRYAEPVQGWSGAPQSVTVHDFVDRGPGAVGFFLEATPIHPMLAGVQLPSTGADAARQMAQLSHLSSLIAIHVDGLLPGDEGGTVTAKRDGRPNVRYPVAPRLAEAFRDAHEILAQAHFAAGALEVSTLHRVSRVLTRPDQIPSLRDLPYGALEHGIFSAHQMGGCAAGPDPATSVVGLDLRHHDVENLFVVDGSILPTALGVNPSETIYGLSRWATAGVAAAV